MSTGSFLHFSRDALAGETLQSALTDYFGARSRASNDGDVSRFDRHVDPSSAQLGSFERNRARFLARGLSQVWDGHILSHDSAISVSSVQMDGARAHVQLHETIRTVWIQNVHPISPALAEFHRRYPHKYLPPENRGPRGEVTSYGTVPHEIDLVRSASGWRVIRDAYEREMNVDASPDLRPGGWAAIWLGKDTVGPRSESNKGPGLAAMRGPERAAAPSTEYNPSAAVSYAHTYASTAGNDSGYNCPPYVNYNPNNCGGDCANFVSQCFRAGGDPDTSTWKTTLGTGCGQSNRQVGTLEWVNVNALRSFLLNSGRGYAWHDIASMANGDMISYDIYGDWAMRHVVLVSANAPGSNPLITGHNENVYDRPYNVFSGNMALTWHWDSY